MTRSNFPREFGEVFEKELERFPIRRTVNFAHQYKLNLAYGGGRRAAVSAKLQALEVA